MCSFCITGKVNDMEEELYWIWVSKMKLVTYEEFWLIINKYKSIKQIWNLKEKDLKMCGISKQTIKEMLNPEYKKNLDKIADFNKKNNIELINCFDSRYPHKLKKIENRPVVLYAKGILKIANSESIRNSWI